MLSVMVCGCQTLCQTLRHCQDSAVFSATQRKSQAHGDSCHSCLLLSTLVIYFLHHFLAFEKSCPRAERMPLWHSLCFLKIQDTPGSASSDVLLTGLTRIGSGHCDISQGSLPQLTPFYPVSKKLFPIVVYLSGSSKCSMGDMESSFSIAEINVFVNRNNFRTQYSNIQCYLK